MRTIKFRAWDDLDKQMYSDEEIVIRHGFAHVLYKDKPNPNPRFPGDDFISVELVLKFLMQFTGLKDKNGVEMYEDDLVLVSNFGFDPTEGDNPYIICKVEKVSGSYGYRDLYNNTFEPIWNLICDSDIDDEAKVIGNIYENPELLK